MLPILAPTVAPIAVTLHLRRSGGREVVDQRCLAVGGALRDQAFAARDPDSSAAYSVFSWRL